MKILEVEISCKGRSDRIEIFPFFDMHIGKANCNEKALRKQVQEILKRTKMPNRHVRILLGGDAINAISACDRKRFDFSDVADWLARGSAQEVKDALADMPNREVKRVHDILTPVKHLILGALEGNHESAFRKRHNIDVQTSLCEKLGCEDLTDEAIVRIRCKRVNSSSTSFTIYLRHGYGAGRAAGAEPNKLDAMLSEWECADVCLSGHTHTFHITAPKAVAMIPTKGQITTGLLRRHRFAANPGSWLDSHVLGRGSYESRSCYPARAAMTCKIVVWPFFEQFENGRGFVVPKIEIRSYPIL